MSAEEYAKQALRDLANCDPFKSIEVLTELFDEAIRDAFEDGLNSR